MVTIKRRQETEGLDKPSSAKSGFALLRKNGKMTEELASSIGRTGKADMHMHTTYSDGCATIDELLEYVQKHT